MDYPPSINPAGSASPRRETPPFVLPGQKLVSPSRPLRSSDPSAWIEILRQAVATRLRSTDSILHAATDAARILTNAHGTALALRTNGVIICRARSGDIAPEIGSPLDTDSGISGACIRRASLLVCNDAANDTRVDATACLALGIRSIVVVPLQGPTGIIGILEAFSTRPHAFGAVQIRMLRELSEIAETAYQHDSLPHSPLSTADPSSGQTLLFASPDAIDRICASQFSSASSAKRRYWIPALVTLAVLLVSVVVWMSWIDPSEIAASASSPESIDVPAALSEHPAPRSSPKSGEASISNHKSERSQSKNVMVNAAEIEPTTASPHASSATALSQPNPATVGGVTAPVISSATTIDRASEPSRPVVVSSATPIPDSLIDVTSTSATVPMSGASISTGMTEPTLIHRLDPTYPEDARAHKVAGSVVLDVTIAEDGSVRDAHVVAGPPLLAKAATDAVQQWRYNPLKLNGRPVAFHQQITIIFKLK